MLFAGGVDGRGGSHGGGLSRSGGGGGEPGVFERGGVPFNLMSGKMGNMSSNMSGNMSGNMGNVSMSGNMGKGAIAGRVMVPNDRVRAYAAGPKGGGDVGVVGRCVCVCVCVCVCLYAAEE